ncbi:hypothetical protein BYT27DRAFT_7252368 [Phlegmacium glaucopus]|nr:hypothetical protein BYT27DRAFT_7252368 [Phlegmacium glaucopus]
MTDGSEYSVSGWKKTQLGYWIIVIFIKAQSGTHLPSRQPQLTSLVIQKFSPDPSSASADYIPNPYDDAQGHPFRIANPWLSSGLRQFVLSVQRHGECLACYADDIVPTIAPFSPASTAPAASQTSPCNTSSTLFNVALNPTGTIATTGVTNTLSRASSSSHPSKALATSNVLTQIVTTARQGGSQVATSEVTLFPTATSQLLLLQFLSAALLEKARNHRFALMRHNSDNVVLNMSQNRTTMATPFTLGPLPSSSRDLNGTHD